MSNGFVESKIEVKSKPPHVRNEDFYWSCVDHDDAPDGFLHLVSVRDGSEIRVRLCDIAAALGISSQQGGQLK